MGLRDRLRERVMPEGGITVDEALALLASGGVLVDVRSLEEYKAGHAPGSRLVDHKDLQHDAWFAVHAGDPLAEPDGTIVLVCDTGLRSGLLVEAVRGQGHRCEFIAGGLVAWKSSGNLLLPGPPRTRR
ncbi:rhodanese-like domain-containing protein [Aestuariimicrobium ganziense]|uniref:rhodanese-like domain-containing protein n=1 Tax=Aestuariimicrobium ganziense TaxID=2773677 RepID=UPI00194157DB|nr:rhodanese-like domain-containing protein [Aestuariimicrobium ganziense]